MPAGTSWGDQHGLQVRPLRQLASLFGRLADVRGRGRHVVYESAVSGANVGAKSRVSRLYVRLFKAFSYGDKCTWLPSIPRFRLRRPHRPVDLEIHTLIIPITYHFRTLIKFSPTMMFCTTRSRWYDLVLTFALPFSHA